MHAVTASVTSYQKEITARPSGNRFRERRALKSVRSVWAFAPSPGQVCFTHRADFPRLAVDRSNDTRLSTIDESDVLVRQLYATASPYQESCYLVLTPDKFGWQKSQWGIWPSSSTQFETLDLSRVRFVEVTNKPDKFLRLFLEPDGDHRVEFTVTLLRPWVNGFERLGIMVKGRELADLHTLYGLASEYGRPALVLGLGLCVIAVHLFFERTNPANSLNATIIAALVAYLIVLFAAVITAVRRGRYFASRLHHSSPESFHATTEERAPKQTGDDA